MGAIGRCSHLHARIMSCHYDCNTAVRPLDHCVNLIHRQVMRVDSYFRIKVLRNLRCRHQMNGYPDD